MTTIDAASRLAQLIREQIGRSRDASALRGKAPARGEARAASSARQAGATDLPALAMQRVASIDPDDPQRARKAFRVFLETVLLAELGEEHVNDPAFYELVGKVQQQMEAHPTLAHAIERASEALLAAAPKR
ncbi:hypothetical protein [Trinickia fusca]|uniref:Uncharacterized protein n=1 Tax=Trinickia fusca TaxID=2419777 RepID=A0A494XD53_9BURK|nr:hypothetical protein [Trinickia fusca]RKP48428.1 hypothetical protein D7S89_14075 [Trinickia fusca]